MQNLRAADRPELSTTTERALRHPIGSLIALGLLSVTDLTMQLGRFNGVYRLIVHWPTLKRTRLLKGDAGSLNAALDRAILYYIRRPTCLHRSAALVALLRIYGIPAQLVIGARKAPFDAHAWVEVDGQPIGERKPVLHYFVLERC